LSTLGPEPHPPILRIILLRAIKPSLAELAIHHSQLSYSELVPKLLQLENSLHYCRVNKPDTMLSNCMRQSTEGPSDSVISPVIEINQIADYHQNKEEDEESEMSEDDTVKSEVFEKGTVKKQERLSTVEDLELESSPKRESPRRVMSVTFTEMTTIESAIMSRRSSLARSLVTNEEVTKREFLENEDSRVDEAEDTVTKENYEIKPHLYEYKQMDMFKLGEGIKQLKNQFRSIICNQINDPCNRNGILYLKRLVENQKIVSEFVKVNDVNIGEPILVKRIISIWTTRSMCQYNTRSTMQNNSWKRNRKKSA